VTSGGFVYILANASRHIYIGSTTNLSGRLHQHRMKLIPGFTRDHNMTLLVYYEEFASVRDMVARERQLKGWIRAKKVALIEQMNPRWLDLSADWER
jgi:putative endonuclease